MRVSGLGRDTVLPARSALCYGGSVMKGLRARPGPALFVGALLVFNANCRPIPSGDTIGAALLPVRIALNGTLNLDPYAPVLARAYGGSYFLQWKDGHAYSAYPIAAPLLLSPLYVPVRTLPGAGTWRPELVILLSRVLEKLTASLIAAATVWCLFLLSRRLMSERRALLAACVYAFATNTWSTSSQALWQHGPAELAMVLSLLFLQTFLDGDRRPWMAAGAGLFVALAPVIRPADAPFFVASVVVLGIWAKRDGLLRWYALGGGLCGGALAAWNLWLFGDLRGLYTPAFEYPFWEGLGGLTVSPSHGLLVFSPVLAFALFGAWRWLRDRPARGREVYAIALLFVAGELLLCAKWWSWWGGECYGPRMMADAVPFLVLLLGPALDGISRARLARVVFAALLVMSVAVQAVGAFCYPAGAQQQEALWDWRRCPIVLNARAGPARAHFAVLAKWGRELLAGQQPDVTGTPLNIR